MEEVHEGEEPPRPFKTWRGLYAIVLLELVVVMIAFGAFTRYFR